MIMLSPHRRDCADDTIRTSCDHYRLEDAMSQANVDVLRGIYDAFARGDVDAVFGAMRPDIEWNESEGMPYSGAYRGRQAIVENVFGPILADVEGFTADPDEILSLDDSRVMAQGRHGGRGAGGPVNAPLRAYLDARGRQGSQVRPARRHSKVLRRRRQVVLSQALIPAYRPLICAAP